jgi:DnaJ-class molecular chaperone
MVDYKKPDLVEKMESQFSSDGKQAFSFLGRALNAFLGNDEEVPSPKKLVNERSGYPQVERTNPKLICNTCGGRGEVGRTGYEVPCPACLPNDCKTCAGTKKLGSPGFEVDCPVCQIEGR